MEEDKDEQRARDCSVPRAARAFAMQALDAALNMLRMAKAATEKTDGNAVLECEQLPRFCGVAAQVEDKALLRWRWRSVSDTTRSQHC